MYIWTSQGNHGFYPRLQGCHFPFNQFWESQNASDITGSLAEKADDRYLGPVSADDKPLAI